MALLLFGFTVFHWTSKFGSWRSRRKRANEGRLGVMSSKAAEATHSVSFGSTGASSSGSTLQDNSSSPRTYNPEYGEQIPLLKNHPKTRHSQGLQVSRAVKAWLVYQPKPIPFFNKTLPSNGTSVTILAFIGIQIFFALYRVPLSIATIFVFADRASLLFAANLPVLYLFAAKNQPIKFLTGYSYESLNIIHRRLGEVMCLLALFHAAGFVAVWYTLLRPVGFTFVRFLLEKIILLGIATFVVYELLYFTSLGSFRQWRYEVFLGLHVSLQVFALIFLWFHHHGSRPYVYAALAIFIIDRFVYRMTLKTEKATGTLEVKDDKATVVFSTRVPTTPKRWAWSNLLNSNLTHGWKATEHVFLTVPELSRKHVFQAHPFTIASKAPSPVDADLHLELIIRAQNGFSRDLLRYGQGHKSVAVRLDGPYGSQSAVEMLQDSDINIIVAGGSGIAVAWPLAWSVIDAQTDDDLEFMSLSNPKKLLFVWVVRDSSHLDWLGPTKIEELRTKGVEVLIPPPTAQDGHPDIEHILGTWITRCSSNRSRVSPKVGVVCSGPDGLNRGVRNTCSALLYQGHDVSVEIEKFGW
ncbi:hypothetical protein MMC07_002202 [Pseudocyphellaria aurata]|nr:hypothetical protein [Pseudocyphellaria aurata]